MLKLQKEFIEFNNQIRLKKYDENKDLRDKRDLLMDELTASLKDEKIPDSTKKLTFKQFDQGSYAMNTGVKPKDDDYDIDVGIMFDITNSEYDSNALKTLVFDKLNAQHNRTVEFNRPCITVKYSSGYHVDIAIYSKNNDDTHIAWGKKNSKTNRIWYKAEPRKLTQWVKDVSTDSDVAAQFRRCVRSLKKWKEKHFLNAGNEAPPSIGLTIQARTIFSDFGGYQEENDLGALIMIVTQIKNQFTGVYDNDSSSIKKSINLPLPVEPYKDVYYKMTLNQQNNFFEKIDTLLEALEAARDSDTEHEASKILIKIFGDKFPLVEDSKKSEKKPVIVPGYSA